MWKGAQSAFLPASYPIGDWQPAAAMNRRLRTQSDILEVVTKKVRADGARPHALEQPDSADFMYQRGVSTLRETAMKPPHPQRDTLTQNPS